MRSNPNSTIPLTGPDYIPTQSMLVVITPSVGPAEQDHFNHEVETVLSDLVHRSQDTLWLTAANPAATFHHTVTTQAIGLVPFRAALANLAERHGLTGLRYTFGPIGGVTSTFDLNEEQA